MLFFSISNESFEGALQLNFSSAIYYKKYITILPSQLQKLSCDFERSVHLETASKSTGDLKYLFWNISCGDVCAFRNAGTGVYLFS